MSALRRLALAVLLAGCLAGVSAAQSAEPSAAQATPPAASGASPDPASALAPLLGAASGAATKGAATDDGGMRLSAALEIAVLLTALSVLPALVITVTSFTRIVIVLSFVRRSLSVNELPPNPVLIALSLFLTMFVMGPVFARAYQKGYLPYKSGALAAAPAAEAAWGELRGFLVANTRASEVDLFLELAHVAKPVDDGGRLVAEEVPFRVIVPAFVLSELKTSFQMGFLLFLPFLVIDLVVASVLISMGMFMLPPVMISTPFKILLFVLVDGWHIVCQSLVTSFATS